MNIKFNHNGDTTFSAFNVPDDREGHIIVDKFDTLPDNEKGLLIGLALQLIENAAEQFAFELSDLNGTTFTYELTRLGRRVHNTLLSKSVEYICKDYSDDELNLMARISRILLRHIAYHNRNGGNDEKQ